jgi:RimJ/RimL family protein N-acetyltransferase
VVRKYWGQGYAPEAAKLFGDFAFNNNHSDSIISIIDIRNLKSQRVAGKKRAVQGKANGVEEYGYLYLQD